MKKIIIFLLFIISFGGYYFFSNYQVFYNPFEIISNEDVAKNEQGICVAENRKLSEAELVTRFLNNDFKNTYYFTYPETKEWGDPTLSKEDMIRLCPDEDSCILRPMPEMTILEYLEKYLSKENPNKVYLPYVDKQSNDLSLLNTSNLLKPETFNNREFPFSFYKYIKIDYVYKLEKKVPKGADFYPKNCCKIISHYNFLKNKLKPDDYKTEEIENNWKKRGWGNYLFNRQYIFFIIDLNIDKSEYDTLSKWMISNYVTAVNNCGMVIDDIYQEKLGKRGMGSIVRFGDINNIVKEKNLTCDLSIDFSNHWKHDFKKFYFYFDNNKLYSCYQN